MATPRWAPSTNNVGTAANWGGSNPANGDEALITGTVDYGLESNLAALAAVTADKIGVHRSFSKKIGASGSNWQISATRLVYAGSGPWAYFEGTYTHAICETSRKDVNACSFDGTITNAYVNSGYCQIQGGAALTNFYVQRLNTAADAIMVIEAGVTGLTLGKVIGGYLELNSALTTLDISNGGRARQKTSGITLTTGNVYAGGHLMVEEGTVTTSNLFGGTLDTGDSGSIVTLTTINAFEGATVRLRRGTILGSAPTLNVHGPNVTLDIDPSIAVTLNLN